MPPTIKLIATDLDGTLIGSANEFPLYSVFRDRVNTLRRRHNAVWAACTGRGWRSYNEFFAPMRTMGLMPDYIVIRHAFIFGLTRFGYRPHIFWNLHVLYQMWLNGLYVREAIGEWHQMITGSSLGVMTIRRERNRLRLRFDTDEAAGVAAEMLREKAKPYRQLRVFKYHQEVDVRAVPFTKGLALTELASHLDVKPDEIMAIGNGHNDISMLDGTVACHTGCPSNSVPEVIDVVHRAGGHIAAGRSLTGVLEIMDAVLSDSVRSDLPANWQQPETLPNPDRRRPPRPRVSPQGRFSWVTVGVVYAVLVVFASFNLVPFSGLIVKPFVWLGLLFEKLLSLLYQ